MSVELSAVPPADAASGSRLVHFPVALFSTVMGMAGLTQRSTLYPPTSTPVTFR